MWADLSGYPSAGLSPWASVLAAAAALLLLGFAGVRAPGVVRVLLIGQAVYWTLGYVVRPVILLGVQPRPAFADNVADPRLFEAGYDRAVGDVLWPVAAGLWCYALLALLLAEWLSSGLRRLDVVSPSGSTRSTTGTASQDNRIMAFATVYILGLIARGVAYQQGLIGEAGAIRAANGLVETATQLAGIGAAALVIFYRATLQRQAVVLSIVAVGELVWAALSQSKTPFIGLVLAFALRLARDGIDKRRFAILAAAGTGVLLMFGWLQSFKSVDGIAARVDAADASYPPLLRALMPLVRRFDLFEASSDVWAAGAIHYLSPSEAMRHIVEAFIPSQLGVDKTLAGPLWADHVRGASLDMRGVSVSLAEGHINEGLLIGGPAGVLIESVLLLGAVYLVARWIGSRHPFLVALALTLVQVPALFERGVLGIAEVAGKGLQLAFAVWLVSLATAWYAGRTRLPSLADQPHRRARRAPVRPPSRIEVRT